MFTKRSHIMKPVTVCTFVKISAYVVCHLFFGCQAPEDKPGILSINEFGEGEIQLRELAQDIIYISLDDSMPVNQILSVKGYKDKILVRTTKDLLMYDLSGRLLRKIGTAGKGPGEYLYIDDMAVDEEGGRIFILGRKKILVYNDQGVLLRTFPQYDDQYYSRLEFDAGNLYFFDFFSYGSLKYNWVITDTLGHFLTAKTSSFPDFKSQISLAGNLVFRYGNKIHYWNRFNDTIFRIKGNEYETAFIFDKGDSRIVPEDFSDMNSFMKMNKWLPLSIHSVEDYLILEYQAIQQEQQRISVWYDIIEDKGIVARRTDPGANNMGIDNHWDSNIKFYPEGELFINDTKYLVRWIDAIMLTQIIQSKEFEDSQVLYPEKKESLRKLAEKLSVDSNPVLMMVTCSMPE